MTDVELVVVRTFLNRIDAEIAQGALQAADIESMISADDLGGQQRPSFWGAEIRLMVRSADAKRATRILGPSQ